MDNTLGVCIVGAGMMGRNHAYAWAGVPSIRIVSIVDTDVSRAQALAAETGAAWFTDYRVAVSQPDVAIVSVCIPAYFHPEVSIYAAEHGKHILCEKPIALTVEKAEAMITAARRHGVRLGIGFQLRHLQAVKAVCRLLQEGAIGRPVMWAYSFAMSIRPKRAMHDMLTGNGGPVIDFCPHRFDLWKLAFGGEAESVSAQGMIIAQDRPELAGIAQFAPDTASLAVRYTTGDIGALHITWGMPPGVNGSTISEIWGPKGLIQFELNQVRLLTEGGQITTLGPWDEDAMREAMRLQAQSFTNAVRAGSQPLVTGEDGLAALHVSLAVIRALESGKTINLKEQL